jgi:hypothetical protein
MPFHNGTSLQQAVPASASSFRPTGRFSKIKAELPKAPSPTEAQGIPSAKTPKTF